MQPTNFPEANVPEIKKPDSWTDEECSSIPAWAGNTVLPGGREVHGFITYWMPTPEDLERLNNGGGIYMSTISNKLVPAMLMTENPFITEPAAAV